MECFGNRFLWEFYNHMSASRFFVFFFPFSFVSSFLFFTVSRALAFSLRGEESRPTTDEDCVGPIDVSSVFSVRRSGTHRRLSRCSPHLLRLLSSTPSEEGSKSTTNRRISRYWWRFLRLVSSSTYSTTLSVITASRPSVLVFSDMRRLYQSSWRLLLRQAMSSVWRSASGKYVTFSLLSSGLVCLIVALWFM